MKPKYRILLSSIDAFGHINCTLAFGEILAGAGHEITFTHRQHYKRLAEKRGFSFIALDESIFENVPPGPFVGWVEKNLDKFRSDALTRYSGWTEEDKEIFSSIVDEYDLTNTALEKVLSDYKDHFDAFIGDFVTRFPALYNSPIPYLPLCSMNPLSLYPQGPPPFSGYSVNVDKVVGQEFKNIYLDSCSRFKDKLYNWWELRNVPLLSEDNWFLEEPKYFGFYHYPAELDYIECGPKLSDKWIRMDALIRKPDEDDTFVVPESLASQSGKLIYFSLGSLGSADVDLMKKMIQILSKSPHRFIVSKGPRGDELALASNMWGQNYVNQIAILKVVDMVITHGGNNTFLETLYYGKPLIVMPFFFDQFDNAQRVVDCEIGRRLDTWDLDETIVLNAIEETLADVTMANKITKIGESMRSTRIHESVPVIIESLIENLKNNNNGSGQ